MHIACCILIVQPNAQNLIGSIMLALGLHLRALGEEDVLKSIGYRDYIRKIPRRYFSYFISIPLGLLFASVLISKVYIKKPDLGLIARVSFAYPMFSLDPTKYDDWSSVFVANHVLLSLLPQRATLLNYSIAKSLAISCASPVSNSIKNCDRIKLSFVFDKKTACDGTEYNKNDFIYEFNAIVKSQNWLFKNVVFCEAVSPLDVCIMIDNQKDVLRKLESVYFRFGWSKFVRKARITNFGFGPYCLYAKEDPKDGYVYAGELHSRDPNFPINIQFKNYIKYNEQYDFDLYGDGQKSNGYVKIDTKTPLGYYIVSNDNIKEGLPWEAPAAIDIIRNHLINVGILRKKIDFLSTFLPGNFTPNETSKNNTARLKRLRFWLPEYIPNCALLARRLNKFWQLKNTAKCVNTNEMLAKYVIPRKHWDGFISPITPGAPTRTAIEDQYFSKESHESWTNGKMARFLLLGVGNSSISLRKKLFCSVLPTKMGLGDLLISDFILCQ